MDILYGDSPVNRGIPLTDAICKRGILFFFLCLSVLGRQCFSIFAWCNVLIENIKRWSKLSCFRHEMVGFIKIIRFPAILAFLRPHTFIVLALLKREHSTSNFMRVINKGNI